MEFKLWILLSPHCVLLISFASGLAAHREKRFTQDDICHETHTTLEFVGMCPDSEPLKLKHSQKKQCDSFPACNGETLVYHCVRYRERLAEVCAPRHVITGKCCALYDDGLGRVVEDYSRPCSECSFRYQSDDILNDPKCLKTSNNTLIDGTNVDENKRTKCGKQLGRRKRDADCNGDKENDSDTMEGNGSSKYTNAVAPIVASVVLLMVMIGLGTYLIQKRSYRRNTTQTDQGIHELETTVANSESLQFVKTTEGNDVLLLFSETTDAYNVDIAGSCNQEKLMISGGKIMTAQNKCYDTHVCY